MTMRSRGRSAVAAAGLMALVSGCGAESIGEPPDAVTTATQALTMDDLTPAACLATAAVPVVNELACAKAVFSAASGAFSTAKSVLEFLGLIPTGPTLDDRLSQISKELTQIQRGVAALNTQVADLNVSVAGYATQNVKILVWTRLSELASLQNDIHSVRLTGDEGTRATTLRYTNNLATFLTNSALYQDGPVVANNWHTPMYAGIGLTQAVTAYATAIEALVPFGGWSGYSFKGDLQNYADTLRTVSAYAKEWADANVTLVDRSAGQGDEFYVPITRRCPGESIALGCGFNPDYVGKVCTCRYPKWELAYNGKVVATYALNLAGRCQAPSQPRVANPCLGYQRYRDIFLAGQADFEQQVGVQGYLDVAARVDAFNAVNF